MSLKSTPALEVIPIIENLRILLPVLGIDLNGKIFKQNKLLDPFKEKF